MQKEVIMVHANVIKKNLFHTTASAVFFSIIVIFSGCSSGNRLNIDVDNIDVKLDIKRFEQDLFALKDANRMAEISALKQKYGPFYYDYVGRIMQWGHPDSASTWDYIYAYIHSQPAQRLYKATQDIYKNFDPFAAELTDAFKHFKYYFPKEQVPAIITFQSQFSNYLNPAGEDYLGISLDMHLGDTFKPYKYAQPEIPEYIFKILTPKHITVHVMMSHANSIFEGTNKGESFADDMVYWGKLHYFMDAMAPDMPDNIKIGFSPAELEWCKKNEALMWEYFVKEKWLYNPNRLEFERFFKEGPHTIASGVPPESAPMIGRYTGWQLVRKYMNEHPEITLQQLMADTDAQKIVKESKYKPVGGN